MQILIDDLLAYSRVGTRGKEFAPTNCAEVLRLALSNLKAAIEENGAVITSDPLPTVIGDDTQLIQLFQNLVGNAVKFHGDLPAKVHVTARPESDKWLFSVRDNGIGIPSEHTEHVFLIFQRLHSREKYPGTGIGLAICRRIVERHGGKIRVESKIGEGSVFYFTLPRISGEMTVDPSGQKQDDSLPHDPCASLGKDA
jgi:light-regulated signal transduction histidine kinase (bacteriophytochrome)